MIAQRGYPTILKILTIDGLSPLGKTLSHGVNDFSLHKIYNAHSICYYAHLSFAAQLSTRTYFAAHFIIIHTISSD